MARIKVTGYIDTESLDEGYLDLDHEMGITDEAFLAWSTGAESIPPMEDLTFEVEA